MSITPYRQSYLSEPRHNELISKGYHISKVEQRPYYDKICDKVTYSKSIGDGGILARLSLWAVGSFFTCCWINCSKTFRKFTCTDVAYGNTLEKRYYPNYQQTNALKSKLYQEDKVDIADHESIKNYLKQQAMRVWNEHYYLIQYYENGLVGLYLMPNKEIDKCEFRFLYDPESGKPYKTPKEEMRAIKKYFAQYHSLHEPPMSRPGSYKTDMQRVPSHETPDEES